jgi:hypothetical protein
VVIRQSLCSLLSSLLSYCTSPAEHWGSHMALFARSVQSDLLLLCCCHVRSLAAQRLLQVVDPAVVLQGGEGAHAVVTLRWVQLPCSCV